MRSYCRVCASMRGSRQTGKPGAVSGWRRAPSRLLTFSPPRRGGAETHQSFFSAASRLCGELLILPKPHGRIAEECVGPSNIPVFGRRLGYGGGFAQR